MNKELNTILTGIKMSMGRANDFALAYFYTVWYYYISNYTYLPCAEVVKVTETSLSNPLIGSIFKYNSYISDHLYLLVY